MTVAAACRGVVNHLGVVAGRGQCRVAHGFGLGTHRRVIEQTTALLHWFRRLRIAGRSATTSTRPSCP
jgi:hypothetical protein